MTYSEKLKDPRWQRKRLEVLEANGFCCQVCGARWQRKRLEVLEANGFCCQVCGDGKSLCTSCHQEWHLESSEFDRRVKTLFPPWTLRCLGASMAALYFYFGEDDAAGILAVLTHPQSGDLRALVLQEAERTFEEEYKRGPVDISSLPEGDADWQNAADHCLKGEILS